ncbi:endonuclease [Hymenobacter koreensis]|uniref:LTD domain-containing protein n=1 Tax=Hymenobacter koreensis TaxID=1084523 RepID=A0ABP8J164_9BACT
MLLWLGQASAQTFPAVPAAPPTNLQDQALRDWLRQNWYDGKRTVLSYSAARAKMYNYVDNDQSRVQCVYSGYEEARPLSFSSTSTTMQNINCEHTVPQSWFNEVERMRSDIHHLFPTVIQWNSDRGSDPFAEIPDAQTTKWIRLLGSQTTVPTANIAEYSEDTNTQFEPREDHKGNLARAVFYFYTVHAGQTFDAGKGVLSAVGDPATLYQWHLQDPVDAREQERNRRAAASQGNYNPYINDPSLVARAWGFVGSGTPTVQFAAASGTQAEGNTGTSTYTFTVTMSAAPTADVTVEVAVDATGSTATAGSDYTFSSPQTLSFGPALPTSQSVTVTVLGDATVEPNEVLRLRLQGLTGPATLGSPAIHDLSIANDDASTTTPTLAFATASGTRDEGNTGSTSYTVTVNLTPAAATTVTVPVEVDATNTTADAADYTLSNTSLSFSAGATSRTFTLTVLGDATVEPDEVLRLRLGTPSGGGAMVGSASTHTLTIRNDDVASGGGALSCGGLYFSEYIESTSGSNKAVEIYNPSDEPVNLAGYRVQLFANGATLATSTLNLTGTLGGREVYVVINNQSTDQNFLDQGDAISGVTNFNGDDALVLAYNGQAIDVIGVPGTDPGTGWTVSGGSTADFTLRRAAYIRQGSTDWTRASATWEAAGANVYTDLGAHTANECRTGPLPVVLTSFLVRREQPQRVAVTWQTAEEQQNAGFVVEKSVDGRHYKAASELLPGSSGTQLRTYRWHDAFAGAAYYRLRQLDLNGQVHLSQPQYVAGGAAAALQLYPNPVNGVVTLLGLPTEGAVTLSLYTAHGQLVAAHHGSEDPAAATSWLNAVLARSPSGTLYLKAEFSGQLQHIRVLKP